MTRTRHNPQTRYFLSTRGLGVSWRPRRRPWLTVVLAGILAYACIVGLAHAF